MDIKAALRPSSYASSLLQFSGLAGLLGYGGDRYPGCYDAVFMLVSKHLGLWIL